MEETPEPRGRTDRIETSRRKIRARSPADDYMIAVCRIDNEEMIEIREDIITWATAHPRPPLIEILEEMELYMHQMRREGGYFEVAIDDCTLVVDMIRKPKLRAVRGAWSQLETFSPEHALPD